MDMLPWLHYGAIWVFLLLNLTLTLALIRKVNQMGPKMPMLEEPLAPGETAPEFEAEALDGGNVSLESLNGKPQFLVFVSPGCSPCRVQIPKIQELVSGRSEVDVALVSLADRDASATMAEELGVTLPVWVAPEGENSFAESYKIARTPSYYHLQNGVVREAGMLDPDVSALKRLLAA